MNADEFNARYRVGTPVLAYPGVRPEDGWDDETLITRTRSLAQVSASGDDVVWVEGHAGYIILTHIDPVTEEAWEQARIDRDATIAGRRAALLDAIRSRPCGGWRPERAAFAVKQAGFGPVSSRTAIGDLEALAAEGHLTPVTEVIVRHYDLAAVSS
ncbi:hypothetical protein AB0C91_10470 [Streptomyces sp. NPDC048674]|uniref:hypothetical protein n=1 Tax=Streptomyces sp. NPDC048674 TaxID=3155491 RepID=UPI00341A1BE7